MVVRIHTGTPTQSRAHWGKRYTARAQIIHADARYEIEAAFDARKSLEQTALFLEIIDQGKHFGTVATDVEADGGAAPIYFLRIVTFANKPTRAIAQANNDCTRTLVAFDVSIRLSKIAKDALYSLRHGLCRDAEKFRSALNDFVGCKRVVTAAIAGRGGGGAKR